MSYKGSEQGEGYYDEEDVFDEYTHERLPTEPARIDLELPQADLDLTMTFETILAEVAPAEPAQECVFLLVSAVVNAHRPRFHAAGRSWKPYWALIRRSWCFWGASAVY